jgi:hypothetical protein
LHGRLSRARADLDAGLYVDDDGEAPPFGDPDHENPIAVETNRVFVTVHNRGSLAGNTLADVKLYVAGSTGGAPPFPGGNWTLVGQVGADVPGQGGIDTVMFDWVASISQPEHTCLIATANAFTDPLPNLTGSLSEIVRDNNNETWKNLHVVTNPEIAGEITNFDPEITSVVVPIEATDVPIGTEFSFSYQPNFILTEFEPFDSRQMIVVEAVEGSFDFTRENLDQEWFSMRGDLPPGEEKGPFVSSFTLKIQFPGGTLVDVDYTISIGQRSVNPETDIVGPLVSGNTYVVSLE